MGLLPVLQPQLVHFHDYRSPTADFMRSAACAAQSTRPRRALEAYPAGILAFVRRTSPLDHQPGLARPPAPAVPFVPSTFTLESTRNSMGESGHEAAQPGANIVPAWPYGPQRAG